MDGTGRTLMFRPVIRTLTQLGPLKMEVVVQEFHTHPNNQKGSTLHQFVEDETTGDVQWVIAAFYTPLNRYVLCAEVPCLVLYAGR